MLFLQLYEVVSGYCWYDAVVRLGCGSIPRDLRLVRYVSEDTKRVLRDLDELKVW